MNWMRWNSPADDLGERLDRHRLGEAGHALDEEVAAGEQRHQHPLEQHVLTDDGPLHLVEGLLERLPARGGRRLGIHGSSSVVGLVGLVGLVRVGCCGWLRGG